MGDDQETPHNCALLRNRLSSQGPRLSVIGVMEQLPKPQSSEPTQPVSPEQNVTHGSKWSWSRIVTFAGLIILGITPWAQAQLPPPNLPAVCPPLTAFASPSLFDFFWGTTPIRFPYE